MYLFFTLKKHFRDTFYNWRVVVVYLRQSLPAAGTIEESESARGERGRVGQGRAGFRA